MSTLKSVTVLKLKVQSPPSFLKDVACFCRKGRNAASEDWLLRQRGKRETKKQRNPESESGKMYHAVTSAVPEIPTWMASMLASEVWKELKAKSDWRKGDGENGEKRRRLHEVLDYEARLPFFTALQIPLHNAQVTVNFGDSVSLSIRNVGDVELSIRKMPPGYQQILRQLAKEERKLADSDLLYKPDKDDWYWHVPVTFETECNPDVQAVLYPVLGNDGNRDRPYRVVLPSARQWWIGDGRYLRIQMKRLIELRKQIGWRYRNRMGSGHGRKKIDAAVSKRRKQAANVVAEVRRRAISDIVKQCRREGVGILLYRRPSNPLKKRCWFEEVGLDWDWTRFESDLKNNCARKGIKLSVKQWKWKDAMPSEDAA